MKIFDFIYYIGFYSAKRNGFSDAPEMYGKIILSAMFFFTILSLINCLYLIGFEFVLEKDSYIINIAAIYVILLFLIFKTYKYRNEIVLKKFSLTEKKIRLYYNLVWFLSLFSIFITTVSIGPLYEK